MKGVSNRMTSAKMYVSTDVVERLTRSGCRPSAESERGFDGAGKKSLP